MYKYLDREETGEYPEELVALGIDKDAKEKKLLLCQAIQRTKASIMNTGNLQNPESAIEREVLAVLGRYNIGRFQRGVRSIDSLVEQYYKDLAEGKIAPLPSWYEMGKFEMELVFDFEVSQGAKDQASRLFEQTRQALALVDKPLDEVLGTYNQIIRQGLTEESERMQEELEAAKTDFETRKITKPEDFNEEKKLRALGYRTKNVEANIAAYEELLDRVDRFKSLAEQWETEADQTEEQLLETVVFKKSQTESLAEGVSRRNQALQVYLKMLLNFQEAYFRKKDANPAIAAALSSATMLHCFENDHDIGISHDLREELGQLVQTREEELTISGINALTEFINVTIKEHSLEVTNFNPQQKKQIMRVLNINALKEDIGRYSRAQAGGSQTIFVVPTRGVLAELGGDLGDACYVRTSNIMRDNPKMNGLAFATNMDNPLESDAVGSCMVIENSIAGIPTLVIRADNPRQFLFDQGGIPGSFLRNFIEGYLKPTAIRWGRAIQAPKVRIAAPAPSTGAFSNRPGLKIDEVFSKKVLANRKTLDTPNKFNNYDITTQCVILEEIDID